MDLRQLIVLACVTLAAVWGQARAADVPVVTGEQWTTSTEDVKKVYLIGIANLMQVETAYYAGNPPSDAQNFVPRLARGLEGQTLDSVRESLNRWYAANPGKLQRPVIETLWFEIAVPRLQKSK
ncbi:MAG: hypothetical protein WCA12_05645 [Burkholderiales bacterium]